MESEVSIATFTYKKNSNEKLAVGLSACETWAVNRRSNYNSFAKLAYTLWNDFRRCKARSQLK